MGTKIKTGDYVHSINDIVISDSESFNKAVKTIKDNSDIVKIEYTTSDSDEKEVVEIKKEIVCGVYYIRHYLDAYILAWQ